MFEVVLANKKKFDADQNKSILSEAASKGLHLEYSCRTGRCGVCKAKVVSGNTSILQEECALTPDEEKSGFILTCCRAAETSLDLDIEDLGQFKDVQVKTLPSRIDSMELLTNDVLKIILRFPPNSQLTYISGQYVDVIGLNGIRRSYSIANSFEDGKKIELHIKRVSAGVMSHYWFSAAKINDLLRIEGPLGTFCFRGNVKRNIIFLATGTGIAPVKSMLEEFAAAPNILSGNKVLVYWGARTEEDIYWQCNFTGFDLSFYPVLSRAGSSWKGRTGYVQDSVIADTIDLENSTIYACGSDRMIRAAKDLFFSKGLQANSFFSDAFVSSG